MYCRLRDLREDHDMKQKDLAAYLNCSQQVYSNYELGQRDVPTDILIRLSQLYHVSVDYILGLSFGEEEIAYLRGLNLFDEGFLGYLKNLKFTGDVYSVPEGTMVFPP